MKNSPNGITTDTHSVVGSEWQAAQHAADRKAVHEAWAREVERLEKLAAGSSDKEVLRCLAEARDIRDRMKPQIEPTKAIDLSPPDPGPSLRESYARGSTVDPAGPMGLALLAAMPGTTKPAEAAPPGPLVLVEARVRRPELVGRIRAGRSWPRTWTEASVTAAELDELQRDHEIEVRPIDRVEREKARAAALVAEAERLRAECDREGVAIDARRAKVDALFAEAEAALARFGDTTHVAEVTS